MNWNDIYKKYSLEEIPWHSDKIPQPLTGSLNDIKKGLTLDVCCGAGTNSIYLAKNGFKVRGIDISKKAIEIAKNRAKKEDLDIDFKTGDIMDLNSKDQFDFVFDRGCFHHMTKMDKPRFVKKIYSILNKNGKYHIMAFSDRNNFEKSLSKEDIHKHFSKYFKIGDIKEEVHIEPGNNKVYLYSTLMTKTNA